ncbi:MAG TPA: EAL domain-containing protein [Noviherbaspirillum sp.]|nr:EAL domain-containing protein [Noviherbaspirillum sp.]
MVTKQSSAAETPTVLIVDDTSANLAVLSNYLGDNGFSVLVAEDGEEGIARAKYSHPDLILMDVMMPGVNGFEACRRLKEDPQTRDIPIVFMTALTDASDKITGFNVGCVDYVTKPFQVEEVLVRVRTHLSVQFMQRQLAAQNLQLLQEIAVRQRVEAELQRARDELEERVMQRTAELAQANDSLRKENIERARMQDELKEREARIRRLFEANVIGIFYWHLEGVISEANDAFLQIIGYSRRELLEGIIQWKNVTPPEHTVADERAIAELKSKGTCAPYEKEYIHKDGRRIPILVGAALFEGRSDTGVAFVLDLSERKKAEARIAFMAHHDALTGLPNRVLLQDRIKQAIAHARRSGGKVAVLFLDLDYFKRINDSLGHEIGDRLLQMTAARLLGCLREDDNLARLGGDEFVLSLPDIPDSSDASQVARKTLETLEAPFMIDGHELHVTGSIGISLYPDDGIDVETLMRAADTAMYHAKEKGRHNYQFFTSAMNKAAHRRLAMENRLRHALASDLFEIHFQPQVDMSNGAIFSSEALLRLREPGKSPVSCGDFIGVAEETGLIMSLGEWVLENACRQLKQWHVQGHTALHVAVNLSARQFSQPNLCDMIARIIDNTGIDAGMLDLEITESILLRRTEENIKALHQLSALGIHLSIDDFGTGYSSLAYLQRYPVDKLKIDQSFVSGITRNANDRALVAAIIAMAHGLDINVLAEGVETAQQAEFLQKHGCTCAQGFYYSEPLPPAALTGMLSITGGRVPGGGQPHT